MSALDLGPIKAKSALLTKVFGESDNRDIDALVREIEAWRVAGAALVKYIDSPAGKFVEGDAAVASMRALLQEGP